MKTVVLSTLSFTLARTVPALVLILVLVTQDAPRPDRTGDVVLAAWLVMLSAGLGALGFLIPTAASAAWRHLDVRRAVVIASVLGLLAPVFGFAVGALVAGLLLPLFRSAPWLAIALFHGLPGVAVGLVAVLVAWAWQRRQAERVA